MDYKKVFHLYPGKYVQVHQEAEPRNTIDIDQTVGAIVLGPQYNLHGGFFKSLLTGKRLWRSHWTPVNMTKDANKIYDTFNSKGCSNEFLFGYFNDQPIPYDYYNFLNFDDGYGNNILCTSVGDTLPDNEGVEDGIVPNDEDINNEIIINNVDSLASKIAPLQNEILVIEGVDN